MKKYFYWLGYRHDIIVKVLLFAITITLLIIIFPREGKFRYEYQRGKPWQHDDLIATTDFGILKSEAELQAETAEVLADARPYFIKKENVTDRQINKLISDFNKQFKPGSASLPGGADTRDRYLETALRICDTLFGKGIIAVTNEIENKPGDYEVYIIDGNIASRVKLSSVFTIRTAEKYIAAEVEKTIPERNDALKKILINSLSQNIVFDPVATGQMREAMLNEVTTTRGMIQAGEKIISRGELVNAEKFQILESMRKDYESRLDESFEYNNILLGQSMLISITIITFILFMISFRKDIFKENKNLLMILLIILLMLGAAALTIRSQYQLLQLLPFCLVPVIIRVFFDTRLAFFVHVVTVVLTGFMVPNGFEFVFQQLVAGLIAIISVAELRRRSQFFITALAVFITYSVVYTGMLLIQDGSLRNINVTMFVFFGGSAMLTLFAYPLIFIFEKLFGRVTDVTLMELSDTNAPLLRQLSQYAPGTFHHSLQVANIAEAAAYEIGANALLVRAGALYHDIGKMDMPGYFIENQIPGINPHDDLGYEESARIIVSHVIKGIDRAKKHKLPEELIDFIRTHHGTRMAGYFYNRMLADYPEKVPNESDFRYPGPVPFSKETSILMMADSVEAASRSLKKPDAAAISGLVESIIDKQIELQQFVNSELTLKDITHIKKILKKRLMSIYHLRIEYPSL